VEPNGSKLWRLKYRFNGTERRLAFGIYPDVTLSRARERQIEARRVLDEGIDPGELKKQAKRAAVVTDTNTFEAVAREWFLKHSARWAESHSCKVLLRLESDLFPWLGHRPVSAIEATELLETIRRLPGMSSSGFSRVAGKRSLPKAGQEYWSDDGTGG
jgi:hypothetical protein